VEEKLSKLNATDLKDDKKLSEISKDLAKGELCELTGHLLESENSLGRSLMIDLNHGSVNNIRQVDHRTIEYDGMAANLLLEIGFLRFHIIK